MQAAGSGVRLRHPEGTLPLSSRKVWSAGPVLAVGVCLRGVWFQLSQKGCPEAPALLTSPRPSRCWCPGICPLWTLLNTCLEKSLGLLLPRGPALSFNPPGAGSMGAPEVLL